VEKVLELPLTNCWEVGPEEEGNDDPDEENDDPEEEEEEKDEEGLEKVEGAGLLGRVSVKEG